MPLLLTSDTRTATTRGRILVVRRGDDDESNENVIALTDSDASQDDGGKEDNDDEEEEEEEEEPEAKKEDKDEGEEERKEGEKNPRARKHTKKIERAAIDVVTEQDCWYASSCIIFGEDRLLFSSTPVLRVLYQDLLLHHQACALTGMHSNISGIELQSEIGLFHNRGPVATLITSSLTLWIDFGCTQDVALVGSRLGLYCSPRT